MVIWGGGGGGGVGVIVSTNTAGVADGLAIICGVIIGVAVSVGDNI